MFRLFRGNRYGDSLFLLLMREGILIGCLIKTFAFLVSSDLRDSSLAGLILRQSSVTVIKNLSVPPSFLYYLRYSVFLTLEQELHSILAKFQCMYTRTRHCWWENSSVLYKNQTLCCGWKNPSVYTRIQYSVVGGRIPVCVYQNSTMSERSLCLYLRIRHSIVGGKIPLYVPESDILLWVSFVLWIFSTNCLFDLLFRFCSCRGILNMRNIYSTRSINLLMFEKAGHTVKYSGIRGKYNILDFPIWWT